MRALEGDLDRFVIFTPDRPPVAARRRGDLGPSLANSLSRPYETVRRHIAALIALGLCERTAQGVVPMPAALASRSVAETLAVTHDSFVRFVEDLRRLGVPLPRQRAGGGYAPETGVQAVADVMLAVTDTNRARHRDWTDLVVFSTIYLRQRPRLCARIRARAAPRRPSGAGSGRAVPAGAGERGGARDRARREQPSAAAPRRWCATGG
ncbi:MAG: hypothetical protein WDN24_14225 [Sphingomonas sp.]